MSVCLYVRLSVYYVEQLDPYSMVLHEIRHISIFRKYVEKVHFPLNRTIVTGTYMMTNTYFF
jgi:hypothetical protein